MRELHASLSTHLEVWVLTWRDSVLPAAVSAPGCKSAKSQSLGDDLSAARADRAADGSAWSGPACACGKPAQRLQAGQRVHAVQHQGCCSREDWGVWGGAGADEALQGDRGAGLQNAGLTARGQPQKGRIGERRAQPWVARCHVAASSPACQPMLMRHSDEQRRCRIGTLDAG